MKKAKKSKSTISYKCIHCSDFKNCKSKPKDGFVDFPPAQRGCFTPLTMWKREKLGKANMAKRMQLAETEE